MLKKLRFTPQPPRAVQPPNPPNGGLKGKIGFKVPQMGDLGG